MKFSQTKSAAKLSISRSVILSEVAHSCGRINSVAVSEKAAELILRQAQDDGVFEREFSRSSQLIFVAIVWLFAPLLRVDAQDNLAPPPASPTAPAAPNSAVPATGGFNADRYAILWTKSPFAVATSESIGEESPDYSCVGVANQDGVFYASIVERQNQEHFLLSSDKPNRGMTLKSINRTRDGQSTFAEVIKDGQLLTLKLEEAPAATPGAVVMPNAPAMGGMSPQIPMPGGGGGGFPNGASTRPFIRFHRPAIHLPPMPAQQQNATPANQTPPPPPQPPPQ